MNSFKYAVKMLNYIVQSEGLHALTRFYPNPLANVYMYSHVNRLVLVPVQDIARNDIDLLAVCHELGHAILVEHCGCPQEPENLSYKQVYEIELMAWRVGFKLYRKYIGQPIGEGSWAVCRQGIQSYKKASKEKGEQPFGY